MKAVLKSKVLITAVLGAMLQAPSVFAATEECNAANGVQGWGAWCGIDTYLTQQESTAAGPVGANGFSGLNQLGLSGDEFGGKVENNPTKITNTSELIAYTFFNNDGEFGLGNMSILLDDDNQASTINGEFDNGKTVSATSDYYDRYATSLYSGTNSKRVARAESDISDFWLYVYSEKAREKQPVIMLEENVQPVDIKDLTYGNIHGYDSNLGSYSGYVGRATDVVEMQNLKNIQATANFNVNSYGARTVNSNAAYGEHRMNVDFGQGSWSMNDFYVTNTSGTITGNTFKSDSIVATNNRGIDKTSFVKGTFIGSDASKLIGEANIIKTKSVNNSTFHNNVKVIFNGSKMVDNIR